MERRQLEYLVAVVDQGSFTRAAETVFTTQPAFSRAIAKLEAELGVRLFRRTGRSIEVTPAGESLALRAREILQSMNDMHLVVPGQEVGSTRRVWLT